MPELILGAHQSGRFQQKNTSLSRNGIINFVRLLRFEAATLVRGMYLIIQEYYVKQYNEVPNINQTWRLVQPQRKLVRLVDAYYVVT